MDLFKNPISDMRFNHDLSGSVFYHPINNRQMIHTGIESDFEFRVIIPDFSEIFTLNKMDVALNTEKKTVSEILANIFDGQVLKIGGESSPAREIKFDIHGNVEYIKLANGLMLCWRDLFLVKVDEFNLDVFNEAYLKQIKKEYPKKLVLFCSNPEKIAIPESFYETKQEAFNTWVRSDDPENLYSKTVKKGKYYEKN